MKNTTLCYIEKDGKYLMLNRNKKANDENGGKWIGVGGKFEDKESPEDCMMREVREETGLTVTEHRYRGIVTFVSDRWPTEYMHLFTVSRFDGEVCECDEGSLAWIDKKQVKNLPQWEGDRIFLNLIDNEHPFFSLKLTYTGELLTGAVLDGKNLEI